MTSSCGPTYRLYLVQSASHAIRAESALLQAGITCALVPVPRTLSSQCGVCLRVRVTDSGPAEEALGGAAIPVSGMHDLTDDWDARETR
jgi:hypothetical protein